MTKYDPAVLQEYADSLYTQARWVTIRYAILAGMIGLAVAGMLQYYAKNNDIPDTAFLILGGFGALIGGLIGQRKGFEYRLEAQTVLCQMQTEINTRKG